eukprot:TRINITY_DN2414_c0_g1_i1.p1 TRINITY_DN2414_c0_g1~~TRINITY_DN2414_c0_g1_i1.p1  ORF type:complete len:343 (+),score=110.64 TRINITY_DN2414_c0_g1_i1:95-1030(+)
MASDVFSLSDNVALYRCLGVEQTASDAEIKRAYRKLAAQFHPDKNPAGEARFKEVSFAYRILIDPEQRQLYDSTKLRAHINRRRDPAMDPEAELSPEALRDFISSLMREEQEQEERKKSFEARRRDEYARRERFDMEHPHFAMPKLPSVDVVRAKYSSGVSVATTAELRAELDRKIGEREAALSRHGLVPSLSARGTEQDAQTSPGISAPYGDSLDMFCRQHPQTRPAPASARQRALDAHRTNRRNSAEPRKCKPDLSFLEQKQYYNGDVHHIRSKVEGFDYTRYVQSGRRREQLQDAILSDALEGYLPLS